MSVRLSREGGARARIARPIVVAVLSFSCAVAIAQQRPDAGQILEQQVAAREQAGKREPDLLLLAEDYLRGLLDDALEGRRGHLQSRAMNPKTAAKP